MLMPGSRAKWEGLARHVRKEDVLRLKNRIWSDNVRDGTARLYFTRCLFLDDWDMSWADVMFPSTRDPGIMYSARILTSQYEMMGRLESQAYDAVRAKMSESEIRADEEHFLAMEPADKDPLTGKVKTYRRKHEEDLRFESLGGKTLQEAQQEAFESLVAEKRCEPRDAVAFVRHCRGKGIGLEAVIPKLVLRSSDIDRFILDFYATGEQPWERTVAKGDPCLLWDAGWKQKLRDDGRLDCGMSHMLGNYKEWEAPGWMREDAGGAWKLTVRDLKEYEERQGKA